MTEMQPIPPALAALEGAKDIQWQPVPIDEIATTQAVAGKLIVGVMGLAQFDLVEKAICRKISPLAVGFDDATLYEPALERHPISQLLRPAGFNGSLQGGYAALLPFSAQRVGEIDAHRTHDVENGTLDDTRIGLRVLFAGKLKKSGAGIAVLMREAVYYRQGSVKAGKKPQRSTLSRSVQLAPKKLEWTSLRELREQQSQNPETK